MKKLMARGCKAKSRPQDRIKGREEGSVESSAVQSVIMTGAEADRGND